MSFVPKSKLPRLPRAWYQGRATVFWTHTLEHRATGWLTDAFQARFRELLIHAGGRFAVATPLYVLMPDHLHWVWQGLAEGSDQLNATRFLRRHLAPLLHPLRLQDRAHDSVLREEQRVRGAFVAACDYVRQNPVRAGLAESWERWRYFGAVVCGYPELDPRDAGFWEDYWTVYQRSVDRANGPGSSEPGYGDPPRDSLAGNL